MNERTANCFDCRHFFVTWDPARPRGCRVLGFKCRELPCQVVRATSGETCAYFQTRPGARGQERRDG